jgi:hypothetical protein
MKMFWGTYWSVISSGRLAKLVQICCQLSAENTCLYLYDENRWRSFFFYPTKLVMIWSTSLLVLEAESFIPLGVFKVPV